MKKISNEELESLMRDLIDKKITRIDLARTLDTDLRTLHKKIMGVSKSNPELYEEYIKEFPYQPRAREDIDYEALVIAVLKRER